MAPEHGSPHQNTTHHAHLTTTFRCPTCRRVSLRRRKLPTVRLGETKNPRRGISLIRMFRRIRLRWLKLQHSCMLKKLKKYYSNLIKDIAAAGGSLEAYHQRLVMETSLAIPVMGVSFSNFISIAGSDCSRSYIM